MPEGKTTTTHLIELCLGYFGLYVVTGVLVKYFTAVRTPALSQVTYLVSNTAGGTATALVIAIALGWFRLESTRPWRLGSWRVPSELAYIIPSGVCTAVVVPATTMLYLLPISVMVAMVLMRGSIIIVSRLVDAIQIRQGLLKRRVYPEENWAVVLALLGVATGVLLLPLVALLERQGVHLAAPLGLAKALERDQFAVFSSPLAGAVMALYVVAYAIRIYIMNYFKNTRRTAASANNKGFFAYEQTVATLVMAAAAGALVLLSPPSTAGMRGEFAAAIRSPNASAMLTGIPFGLVAFFSVFIFMFGGRTATFTGLVNRVTSLLAGITATLVTAWAFGSAWPAVQDWVSVAFLFGAVVFLTKAERRRAAEVATERT